MFGICPCLGWQHLAVNQQIGKAVDVNMARIKKLETIQKLQRSVAAVGSPAAASSRTNWLTNRS